MTPNAKLSLLEIEQEVEARARVWHRQRLQKRLQQVAEEQGRSVRSPASLWKRSVMRP
jgi:hypothetical protein